MASAALAWLVVALATTTLLRAAPAEENPSDKLVRTYDVAWRNNRLYLAQTSGLARWDLTEVDHPREIDRLVLPATIYGVALDGSRAYLAAGSHGLYVTDLGDEEAEEASEEIRLVSRFDTPGSVRRVLLHAGRVLLADDRYGVRVIDISLPERPLQSALLPTRSRVVALAMRGDLLATAEDRSGVRLFDLRDPDNPRQVGELRGVRRARDLAFAADRLCVAAGEQGLLLFRVEQDGGAERVGELGFSRPVALVAAEGSTAVVGTGTPTLYVVGLADDDPQLLGSISVHRSAPLQRLHLSGTRVWAAVDVAGPGVIDLVDRSDPQVLLPRERRLRISFPSWDELEGKTDPD